MNKFIKCKRLLLICLCSLSIPLVWAQQNIKGVVKDTYNEPLTGVNVVEKGTTNGTVTDINGNFSLQLNNANALLLVSFIGFVSQELVPQVDMAIVLQEETSALDEVVVVGYAVQRKINLSGAVDQVSQKTLQAKPITNLAQGLQGVVPNLNIWLGSGQPGANANINIRGITSVNGGQPLIMIDGIPSETTELNRLASTDIESISVLKDASSSAIYGARAAFGVILITTRKGAGETDRITVDFTSNFDWKKATVLPNKVADPYIFARLLETSVANTPWYTMKYSDYQLEWARQRSDNPGMESVRMSPVDNKLYDYMGGTDWTRHYMDKYTFSHNQQLSISGRSARSTFYLSANSAKEYGAIDFAKDNFTRQGLRSNVDFKLLDNFTIGNNTSYVATIIDLPSYMNIQSLFDVFPTDVDKNPNGTWANTDLGWLMSQWTSGGRSKNRDDQLTTTFTAKWELFNKMLVINGDYTFRRKVNDYRWNYAKYMIGYGPDDTREHGTNEAYRSYTSTTYNGMNIYANLNKSFGKHALSAIIGYNQEEEIYDGFYGRIDQLVSAQLPSLSLATGTARVGDWYSDWAVRGVFGRLNYTFDDKYILEFNGRYDGSSRFPQKSRFHFFPSVSAAWRVDRESFMNGTNGWLSMLKLRGSYGSLGNQAVSNYGYISAMSSGLAAPIINDQRPMAIYTPAIVSANYSWETVTTVNGGIDIGLFNSRVTTSFDLYRRNTEGMLVPGKELPATLGTSAPRENAADLKTTGWEWSLSYNNSTMVASKLFSFNARFVLSDSRSFITRFDNPTKLLRQYYKGMEMGEIWGLVSDGFFNSQAEIDALDESDIIPWDALAIVNGWPKYKDLDHNGRIEIGTTVDDPKDIKVIGNSSPRFNYGFNLGASWNGIDVDLFIQGIGKRDYYPTYYLYWGFYQQPYAGGYEHLLDFYRENDDTDISRHSQSYINAGLANQNHDARYPVLQSWLADRNLGTHVNDAKGLAIPQTGYMLNGSYLRLKNLTIGYTLPRNLTEKARLQRLRIYISGENLFEFSELRKYFDPEAINSLNENNMTATNNGYTYPFQRRYTLGLNVTF